MAHDDDAHESMGGVQRGDGPGHSRPAEFAPLNDHINQQILQTHRKNPKLGVEGIGQQLDELGLKASPAQIADVLVKDRIEQRTLEINRNDPKLRTEGIRRTLFAEGLEASHEYVTDVLKKHGKL